jgi:hypothetical protein
MMRVHDISHLLTFDGTDFMTFPGIIVADPQDVVSGRI